MNTRMAVALTALAITASACRSPLQRRSYSPIALGASEVVRSPPLNVDVEAAVGTSMMSATKRATCPGIKLAKPLTHRDTRYETWFELRIPGGVLFAAATDRYGTFFEAVEPIEYVQVSDGSTSRVRGGVFVSTGPPTVTEIYWLVTGDTPFNLDHPGIEFQRVTVDLGSKREFIYGGGSQNTITVLYREYVGDMARPASSQELKYDLSKGDVIEHRGARFQVGSVTDTGIKYRVLTPLE